VLKILRFFQVSSSSIQRKSWFVIVKKGTKMKSRTVVTQNVAFVMSASLIMMRFYFIYGKAIFGVIFVNMMGNKTTMMFMKV